MAESVHPVVPSRYEEPPADHQTIAHAQVVLLEAMLRVCAIVATEVGSILDAWETARPELLVPVGCPNFPLPWMPLGEW